MTINHNVRMQTARIAEHDIFTNDAVWADLAIGANTRIGMDNGSRMNHGARGLAFNQHEGDFRFTDDGSLDGADTLGFSNFAPGFCQLNIDH